MMAWRMESNPPGGGVSVMEMEAELSQMEWRWMELRDGRRTENGDEIILESEWNELDWDGFKMMLRLSKIYQME